MKKSVVTILLISLGVFLIPKIAFAKIELNIPIGGVTSVDDLGEYIRIFYEFFVTSAGVLAAVMMVIGGYKWVTAAGNASMIDGAKELVMSAVMGLVLALTSYLILNAINPNITSLAPLVIPGIDELTVTGVASRICNFATELDRTDPAKPKPVDCGKGLYINPEVNDDKCLGVATKSPDRICQVINSGGVLDSLSASEKESVRVENHTVTNQRIFTTNNNDSHKPCGTISWGGTSSSGGHTWRVSSYCGITEAPPGGDDARIACVLEGKYGDFVKDENVCAYINKDRQFEHENGFNLSGALVVSGCGKISNMHCAGTP